MQDLVSSVDRTISARRLCARGESLLVAVSGGLDSMVLLHVLAELSSRHSWRLIVAHLNHQLRGRSSNADERFVEEAARKLKLRFVSERADVKAVAAEERLSIEMAARKCRHEFLARTARRLKVRTIVVAHHADDQIELFFLRLLRGAGNEGLGGMKWKSPSPVDSKITLIRPLLDQPKEALKKFAEENRLRFREDVTNASADFQRNRIRHELLPMLKKNYQSALPKIVLRLMETVATESEFLNQVAEDWLKAPDKTAFDGLHVAVQRRCLQLQLLRLGVVPDFEMIETLRTTPGSPLTISPNRAVQRDSNGSIQIQPEVKLSSWGDSRKVELKGRAGEIRFDGVDLSWRIMEGSSGVPKRVGRQECFDADKVGSEIILRHWQPGDRFQPIGMSSPKKLQDLFTNQKIPRDERRRLVIATTSEGEIFWVENLRISERFKITDATIRRLLWRWKPR